MQHKYLNRDKGVIEIWKSVKGHPQYLISNMGRIMSFNTKTNLKRREPLYMKLIPNKQGYFTVSLNSKKYKTHNLVLDAFVGSKPTPKHECCHIDGNKTNNFYDNLRWGTHAENMHDKIAHGTASMKGKNYGNTKLKQSDIPIIRNMLVYRTCAHIGRLYGVSESSIHNIKSGKTWKSENIPSISIRG